MRTFQFSISSPRNISFRYSQEFTLDDMFAALNPLTRVASKQEQAIDDYGRELLFDRYIEWSVEEIEG